MICNRCEDQGTIPIDDDKVARCPDCGGTSYMMALHARHERRDRRATILAYVCVAILGISIGIQFAL